MHFDKFLNEAILSCLLQENKQEGKQIWNMFKQDPLSPAKAYWHSYGMPGIGLFLEGYVVSDMSQLTVETLHSCVAVPIVLSNRGSLLSQSAKPISWMQGLNLSAVGLLYQQQQYLIQADLPQVLEQVH